MVSPDNKYLKRKRVGHIPEVDAINLVVLKDQIFFKTDTFYMPNQYTSDSTDLKNYVNSISIANYTKEFTKNTVVLLNEVYKKVWQDLTKENKNRLDLRISR